MNFKKIYIISWLGRDDAMRAKRLAYHQRQLEWVHKQGLQPVVLAQDYELDELQPNVDYRHHSKMLPGFARDILLKEFYASDDDYAIFADDDAVLHEGQQHALSRDFVELFNSVPMDKLTDIDCFVPLNPARVPFNKTYNSDPTLYKNNFVFARTVALKGSFFVVKNLRKYHNKEIYFDQQYFQQPDGKMIGGADIDFGLQILNNNLGLYCLTNTVLKEFGHTLSTWAVDHGGETNIQFKNRIAEKYNLTKNRAGHLQYKTVYNNNPTSSKVIVSCK